MFSHSYNKPRTEGRFKKKKQKQRPYTLSGYSESPNVEFNIDEFESFAISRLNVLRWVEKQIGLGMPIDDTLTYKLQENGLHKPLQDEISHFIGRLCFCQTTERRRWFLQTEKALFEARYKLAQPEDQRRVHQQLCSGYASYKVVTKNDILQDEDLNGKTPIPRFFKGTELKAEKEILPYYKVPFAEVLTLVGRRGVHLSDGYAYVPSNKFFTLITGKFRTHLNRGLASAKNAMDKMRSDPVAMDCVSRVIHIIDGLHKMTTGPSYKMNKSKSAVTHKEVNKLSPLHFPLCMQSTMEHMKHEGHLKHGGRMHLGLFLKGIGLSLSEAIIYWRNSFTKLSGDKFNKQYAYNVRHNYGKEGKRIDYSPYSCSKIISCSPSNGDYHGCPFKIFDHQNLRKYLVLSKKMKSQDVEAVMELVKGSHYQLACRSFFQHQHRDIMQKKSITIDAVDSQWSHPNEYFDHSYMLYHGEKLKKEEEVKGQGGDVEMNGTAGGMGTGGVGGDMSQNKENQQGGNMVNTNTVAQNGGMEVDSK